MLSLPVKSSAFWHEKLVVDFLAQRRLHDVMDEDRRDLINQLATRAGMLMEDTSVIAITLTGRSEADLPRELENLETQVSKMSALLRAARRLAE